MCPHVHVEHLLKQRAAPTVVGKNNKSVWCHKMSQSPVHYACVTPTLTEMWPISNVATAMGLLSSQQQY